jgi:hypothetical protein
MPKEEMETADQRIFELIDRNKTQPHEVDLQNDVAKVE